MSVNDLEAYVPVPFVKLHMLEQAIEVYEYNVQYCLDKIEEDVNYILELSGQGDPCIIGTRLEYTGYGGSFREWFRRKILRKDRLVPLQVSSYEVYHHLKRKFLIDEWWEAYLKREIIVEAPESIVSPEFKDSVDDYVSFIENKPKHHCERRKIRNLLKQYIQFAKVNNECLWLNSEFMAFVRNNQKKLGE